MMSKSLAISIHLKVLCLNETHARIVLVKRILHWTCPEELPNTKTLRSNILKILQPKKENFQINNSDIFQNIDCGSPLEPPRRGGSNEYPQSICFFSKISNIMYNSVNPNFTI